MSVLARRLAALPPLALVWLLAGCTGASAGKADPNAAPAYADKFGQFLIDNGKAVAVVLMIVAAISFLGFLLRSKQIQILAALAIGMALAYFALKGGHR